MLQFDALLEELKPREGEEDIDAWRERVQARLDELSDSELRWFFRRLFEELVEKAREDEDLGELLG